MTCIPSPIVLWSQINFDHFGMVKFTHSKMHSLWQRMCKFTHSKRKRMLQCNNGYIYSCCKCNIRYPKECCNSTFDAQKNVAFQHSEHKRMCKFTHSKILDPSTIDSNLRLGGRGGYFFSFFSILITIYKMNLPVLKQVSRNFFVKESKPTTVNNLFWCKHRKIFKFMDILIRLCAYCLFIM